MADNDDSIMNKRPNSLDRIGSTKSVSSRYPSDLLLMEQRSRIETLEMQKLRQQINDMYREREELMRQVGRVRGGAEQPTESLFRSLGLPAPQARAAMSIPAENLIAAVTRQSGQYEKQFSTRAQELTSQYEQKQQERQAVASRMFEQHVISRVAHPRAGMRPGGQVDESLSAMIEAYATSGTPQSLARGMERISRSRETAGMRLAEAAKNVQTPEGKAYYIELEREYQEKLRKEHALEEASRVSQRRRSELETISGRGQRTVESIMERRGELEIRAGVQKGQFGSMKDIQQNLKSAEDAFISAMSRFNNELAQTQKVSDETAKSLKDANTELEKQRTIASEASAGGRGGGRRSGLMMMAGMGDIIGRGVDFMSYAGVGLQAEQMSMRIQAAGTMNQKYNDLFAASQGDMAALRRVSQDQFARSAEYGGVYGGRAAGLGAVGAGVDLATGAAAGAATLATGGVPWSISGGLVVGNLISGARGAARVGAGVTRAEAELNAAAQYRQLLDTVNAVPDTARQALFDYRMQAFRGMMGAGSGMSGLYSAATSRQTVEGLSALGIAPSEQAALFGTGARAIGPSFMRDPNAAAQMVTRAAEVQAAGVMSAQSYMQRVGQVTTLGGGAKDVEEILASAVARGVDDAKSLEGIMDLAQAMSRDSAARGIGAITEVQRGLSFGLEQYKDLPIDESLKRGLVGYQQQDVVNRIKAGGSRLGFEAMGFMSTLTSQIPGMTSFEAGRLAGKDPREMEAVYRQYKDQLQLGKQVPDSVIAALGDYAGLFVDPSTGRGRGRTGLDVAKAASVAMPLDAMFASGLIPPEERSKIMDAIKTNDISKLSPRTKNIVGGLISGAAGISGQAYQVPTTPTPLQPLTGEAGAAQLAAIAQATGQSGQILQAQKMLGETAPMSLISQVMTTAARTADVEQAGKEAAQAGEKMTIDTSKFDASVTRFSEAVDKLSEAVRPLGMSKSATSNLGGGSEFFERFGGPVSLEHAILNLNRVK